MQLSPKPTVRAVRAGLALAVALAPSTAAQSSPSNLSDLSLAELMELRVVPLDEALPVSARDHWSLEYRYVRHEFDGYRDGTRDLSNEDVLFRPGETRTNENFPVLPTEILQEAHVAELGYRGRDWSFSLIVPYIRQSTDHISVVPGYAAFEISSDGMGDVAFTSAKPVWRGETGALSVTAGISAPTGSIDESGDTPRAPGNQQLPYTMQLGSGTWDVFAGSTLSGHSGPTLDEATYDWGALALGKVRLGRNDRDYSLGDSLFASLWVGLRNLGCVRPTLRLNARSWGRIDGQDDELTVPGAFPYPAPVTNPRLFGGRKLSLHLGLEARLSDDGRDTLRVELGGPLYQSLNGPQPQERWALAVVWNAGF